MNQKTLFKLEYDKIIALLEKEATSFRGGQLCRRLKPMTDLHKINTYQEQTAAAYTRIVQKGRISFGDAAPVEESMKRLEIGGSLSSTELLRISRLLVNAARVKAYGRHDTQEDACDCLDEYFNLLEPLTPLSNEIDRCIIGEDEYSDDASSTLKQIRRSINNWSTVPFALICRMQSLPCVETAIVYLSKRNIVDRYRDSFTISLQQVLLFLLNLWQS